MFRLKKNKHHSIPIVAQTFMTDDAFIHDSKKGKAVFFFYTRDKIKIKSHLIKLG